MRHIFSEYNYNVYHALYDYDLDTFKALNDAFSKITIEIPSTRKIVKAKYRHRNQQTIESLCRLGEALNPGGYKDWLLTKRRIVAETVMSIDFSKLKITDMYDFYICPDDYYLDKHGDRPVEGPVFPDIRNGSLAGICIRNLNDDLNYVTDVKYTFSNYGWYLYGYDECNANDEVFVVEGVFDVLAMRAYGYKAIGLGCSMPSPMQLAMLLYKFKNLKICLDNDLAGYIGAYRIRSLLNVPIFICKNGKDIAECWEKHFLLELCELNLNDLRYLIKINYNNNHSDFRDLRYN